MRLSHLLIDVSGKCQETYICTYSPITADLSRLAQLYDSFV